MSRSSLLRFAARRLAALVGLALVASLAVFSLLHITPGSAVETLVGTRQATPELVATLRERFHLDESLISQYLHWLTGALQLDLGESVASGRSVSSVIGSHLSVTLFLSAYAFLLALLVSVPLGVWAAVRKRTPVDRTIVGASVLGVSSPVFVTGVVLLWVFSVVLGWFPSYGAGEGFADRLWHLTLPAITLAFATSALIVKHTRAAMIRVLDEDYVSFAAARGVPRTRVLLRHGVRNALVPVITAAGAVLTVMLTTAVIVEVTFSLPGLGSLLIEAVVKKDLPVIQGVTLVIATAVIAINIAVDIAYALADPRIELGRRVA